eukprot:CAMPEP_0117427264 /NCGR_PEP_ID=MMETSP0758-20121206/7154_1 /TAXON_ID=63605 /ORGANISM="Percolomonas cosmopolitus, Strain AE-1 (ATCC 50343)" /LENGTH=709 /DNA_ID=CAMNT_0005212811 /DNA_START=435 /DNA_END=2564 /DNA_ORIENTATION=-
MTAITKQTIGKEVDAGYIDELHFVSVLEIETEFGRDQERTFEKVMAIYWNDDNGREGLPNPTQPKHALEYFKMEEDTYELKSSPISVDDTYLPKNMDIIKTLEGKQRNLFSYSFGYSDPHLEFCKYETDNHCVIGSYYGFTAYENPLNGTYVTHVDWNRFPEKLKAVTEEGDISFIINAKDKAILASSENILNYYKWNSVNENHEFINSNDFSSGVVRECFLKLQLETGETFEKIEIGDYFVMEYLAHDGQPFLVSARRINLQGLDVIVVYLIPELKYTYSLIIIGAVAGIVTIVLALVGLIGGTIASICIYRPLRGLMNTVVQLTDGLDVDNIQFGKDPYFTEFKRLQDTFNLLVLQMRLYRTFLPEHILKQVDKIATLEQYSGEKDEKQSHASEINSNSVESDRSSSLNSTSVASSEINSEAQNTLLSLKRVSASYIVLIIQYDNVNYVSDNMHFHSQLLTLAIEESKARNGRVENFSDTEIIIGFNTIIHYKHHGRGACDIALRLEKAIDDIGSKNKVGIGMSSDIAHVGTIGNDSRRTYQSLSNAVDQARNLSALSIRGSIGILIDESITSQISSNAFQYRFADSMVKSSTVYNLYHLATPIKDKEDEWIYELEQQSVNTWSGGYQNALDLLFQEDLKEAESVMNHFLEQFPKDHLALEFLSIIHYCLNNAASYEDIVEMARQDKRYTQDRPYYSILHYAKYFLD